MSTRILPALFAQKSWANSELFDLMATINQPEHAAALEAATRMLNHIYVVDRIFRAHLLGQPHGYTATNPPPRPQTWPNCISTSPKPTCGLSSTSRPSTTRPWPSPSPSRSPTAMPAA